MTQHGMESENFDRSGGGALLLSLIGLRVEPEKKVITTYHEALRVVYQLQNMGG